jgi:hypothetical protein
MHAFRYHAQLSGMFSVLTVIAIELSATRADTVLSSNLSSASAGTETATGDT